MTDKLKPCPLCGGEAVIREQMGNLYIRPIHKKKCVMRPDTWLLSNKPLKIQIKAWNRRVENDR